MNKGLYTITKGDRRITLVLKHISSIIVNEEEFFVHSIDGDSYYSFPNTNGEADKLIAALSEYLDGESKAE